MNVSSESVGMLAVGTHKYTDKQKGKHCSIRSRIEVCAYRIIQSKKEKGEKKKRWRVSFVRLYLPLFFAYSLIISAHASFRNLTASCKAVKRPRTVLHIIV